MALSDSLIAWWTLNEESGTREDSVGSNDLTDNNTVLYGTGKAGNAADFEEDTEESLISTDTADLSMGDIDFSWSIWVTLETNSARRTFLGKNNAAGDNASIEYIIDYNQPNDVFRFVIGDGTNVEVVEANNLGSPSLATWYHIVCWHDATANTINIVVNNGTVDSAAWTTGSQDSLNGFAIGRLGEYDAQFHHDGLIDEVGLWKKALSAAERKRLYNGGNGIIYPFSWETLTGTITPAGAAIKGIGKSAQAGTVTPAGAVIKGPGKLPAGTVTPVGTYIRGVGKLVAGAVTPVGTIERLVAWYRSLAGTVTPAGTIVKGITLGPLRLIGEMFFDISGVIYPHITGTLTKGIGRAFAGVITPAGRLLQRIANFFRIWFDGSPETVARIDITATADIQVDDSPEATVILER